MKRAVFIVVGVVLILAGVVWTLQGLGDIGGSAMSGKSQWAVIGPIVTLVGLGVAAAGFMVHRPQR